MRISERIIGTDHPPFIIAEMSGNHNQSLDHALAIVDAAAKAGVHALKLQTYTPDTMTLDISNNEFFIEDPDSLWKGNSLYSLYQQAYTPWEWHQPLFEHARKLGMIAFSTPFDETAVEFLESLDVPCYKIASFENTDINLIRTVATTGKPIIMSTGMATLAELDESVSVAREAGCQDLILLKCTSTYPAHPEDANLLTIPHMRHLFNCEIGLSDHTLGIGTAIASIALGATVIEKHFTLNRSEGGVDSAFSIEPHEITTLVWESERAWRSLGKVFYGPTETENTGRINRRSLYITQDMKAGEMITKNHMRAIRPGRGLPIKYYPIILGRRVNQDLKKGTPLKWEVIA